MVTQSHFSDFRSHSPDLRNCDRGYHTKKLLALAKLPVMKSILLLRHLWLVFLSSQASSKRLPRFTLRLTVDRPNFLSPAPCAATRRRRWPNFMDQPRGETSSKKAMAQSLEVELREWEWNQAFEQPCLQMNQLQGPLQEVTTQLPSTKQSSYTFATAQHQNSCSSFHHLGTWELTLQVPTRPYPNIQHAQSWMSAPLGSTAQAEALRVKRFKSFSLRPRCLTAAGNHGTSGVSCEELLASNGKIYDDLSQ